MVVEKTSGLSASVHKVTGNIEPGPTEPVAKRHLRINDSQHYPTVESSAQMLNSQSSTSYSANHLPRRSPRRNRAPSIIFIDDDSPLTESSSEVEITSPKQSPARKITPSQRSPKPSKHLFTSISSSSSPPTSTSGARAIAHTSANPTNKTVAKSLSTVPHQLRSDKPATTSVNVKSSVSKKREIPHQASPVAHDVLNPKPQSRVSASPVIPEDLPMLAYDLDNDPTQETYEVHHQFHERSPFSAFLSARFIHAHLFERLPNSTTLNDEHINGEGDLVAEFIEPAAMASVGPPDEVTPSFTVDSAQVLVNLQNPSNYGDLDLGGDYSVADPFAVMTMDDIINYQPWGPSIETMIDPALLSGTPAFSEPRFPSPAPAPFRDFHSRKRPRVHSPPPVHPALRIRIPPASTSQSNSAKSVRDSEGNSGGGKAKFYRKGTLQTPPHLSNSQGQRSVSAKTTPSTHVSRHLSPDHALDSPLTELSAWGPLASGTASTSSVALSSGMANIVDDDTTFINSDSGTPPRVTSAKATTSQNRKRSTNTEGPYRIVAVNENAFCHQCRRSSLHPKMSCRTCAKLYCILCIVKRYHDIEFQQFKKNFDCPACLDKCNCTSCCEKRKEVYITTRHIKFDKETMAKLLSGEIRSLPHLAASFSSSHEGPKSRRVLTSSVHRELPARKARTRRRRVTGRRYDTSDDDYDEDDESNVQDSSVRVKPAEAALQTQRMLEESGSGSHWGTVYSLNGERIGTSYVGNNLQNVTVQTAGFSSGSVTGHPPSRRNRVYAGRWQDAWGPRSEDSRSEDEISADKRGRNKKDLGRARIYYVGNHKIIKAWRKAQSKIVQSPPVLIPSSDDIHIPSPDPPSLDKAYDPHEATGALSSAFIQIGEEEEDASGNYWTMEDRSPPKERNLPFFASTNTPGLDLDNIYNVFDIRSTPTLESCEHLVSQEALAQVVASSLEAAGTTVLLSQQPLSLSTLSC